MATRKSAPAASSFIARPTRNVSRESALPPLNENLLRVLQESYDARDGENAFFVSVKDTPVSKVRTEKGQPMVEAQNTDTATRFVRRHAAELGIGVGVHVQDPETLIVWGKVPRQVTRKSDEG